MARLGLKLGELWRRIVFLRRGRQFDAEIEEELRFHAAMKADGYRADGAAPKRPAMRLCAVSGTQRS